MSMTKAGAHVVVLEELVVYAPSGGFLGRTVPSRDKALLVEIESLGEVHSMDWDELPSEEELRQAVRKAVDALRAQSI